MKKLYDEGYFLSFPTSLQESGTAQISQKPQKFYKTDLSWPLHDLWPNQCITLWSGFLPTKFGSHRAYVSILTYAGWPLHDLRSQQCLKNLRWTKLHPLTEFEPRASYHLQKQARTNIQQKISYYYIDSTSVNHFGQNIGNPNVLCVAQTMHRVLLSAEDSTFSDKK